ncbi:MAG: hypothetical protein A2711_11120 [Burkholderiales bacterium RIFCSPHIGHO2_01_FULL_63_240]|jgi:hypothetical protein|nr:MAG: hypothetical protein A2711_11120 [Burkholderiales bacterium RIFCSPHIGHO2_01_FULL_63_240]
MEVEVVLAGQDMSWTDGAGGAPVDARGANRVNAHWRARVLISSETFIEGRTVNVSEGGVSLLLDRRFPDGTLLTVALAVPDPIDRTRLQGVTAQAKVVFNVASGDLFRLGLHFTQVPDDGRQAIRRWVHLLMA